MGTRSPDKPSPPLKRGKKVAPRDANCRVQIGRGKKRVERSGVVVLTDDELRFHTGRTGHDGKDFYLHVAYDDITAMVADAHAGTLTLATAEEPDIVLHVGRYAADWKKMIEERPSRLDELGIKPTSRVALAGVDLPEIEALLVARVPGYSPNLPDEPATLDVLLTGAEHRADLARLEQLARRLKPGAFMWVVFPTGARAISDAEITAAGKTHGLVRAGDLELPHDQTAVKLVRV